jgi:hypothetical protein
MTEWRKVVGYEAYYEVSDEGIVRSLDRPFHHGRCGELIRRGKVLAQKADVEQGRLRVRLVDGAGHVRFCSVHRIELEAFVGACPPQQECCHGDGNFRNNHLGNLRWDTRSANMFDRVRHGTHHSARKTHCKRRHEFTPENTYVFPNGYRQCRICYRDRARAKYWEQRNRIAA